MQSTTQKKLEKNVSLFNPTEGSRLGYTTIEYPIGSLGSDRYPHYTIFYINEDSKSVIENDIPVNDNALVRDKSANISTATVAAKTINTIKNGAIAATVATVKELSSDDVAKSVEKSAKNISVWGTPKKRLKMAICLPMPQKVRANYNASYSETEAVGALGAVIAAAVSKDGDAAETALLGVAPVAVGAGVKRLGSLAGKVIGAGAAKELEKGADPKAVAQIASKLSGRVINKRQEQLFNNMEFRTHMFSYIFIPRTEEESENISQIIENFKLYMHPELNAGAGSSLLITPSEFDIEFRYKADENKKISRIATCALKSCEVNYTAIGEFVAFDGTPNPVAISLDLVFVEMEPINRTMIKKGF